MATRVPATRIRSLLGGASRVRTRRALLLAGGFFAATATLRAVAPTSPLHACCHDYVFAILAPFIVSGNGLVPLVFVQASVTMGALAAIQAYLNEGYLPSLLLAVAPSYGFAVFNGPGAAPIWAAGHVLPVVLTAGTLGFLLGLSLRRVGGTRRLRAGLSRFAG